MPNLIERRSLTQNAASEIREWILPFVNRLSSHSEIEGVVLLSGVAEQTYRRFADLYSDVDMAVFLNSPVVPDGVAGKAFALAHQEKLPLWLPDYYFPVPLSSTTERRINMGQHFLTYESREDVEWSEGVKEAFAYTSEIVYDREGDVRRLIDSKIRYDEGKRNRRLVELSVRIPFCTLINPERQVARGFVETAHDILNEGVDLVVEDLFLLNRRFRPHRKWRLIIAEDLPWKPDGWSKSIRDAMIVLEMSGDDVKRRMTALDGLATQLVKRSIDEGAVPPDCLHCLATSIDTESQLRVTTVADEVVSLVNALGLPIDIGRLRALVNLQLIDSPQRLLDFLDDPSFECPSLFEGEWAVLKLNRSSIQHAMHTFEHGPRSPGYPIQLSCRHDA